MESSGPRAPWSEAQVQAHLARQVRLRLDSRWWWGRWRGRSGGRYGSAGSARCRHSASTGRRRDGGRRWSSRAAGCRRYQTLQGSRLRVRGGWGRGSRSGGICVGAGRPGHGWNGWHGGWRGRDLRREAKAGQKQEGKDSFHGYLSLVVAGLPAAVWLRRGVAAAVTEEGAAVRTAGFFW